MVAGLVAARRALQISSDQPVVFFLPGPCRLRADSNGCAAGNTLEEAIVQGFLELVERDAYAIWWYNRLQRPEVDLGQFDDSYVRDLQTQLAETGRRLWVLDVTSDLGIPTFVAITHWMQNGQENIEFGSGAHFDARIALLRALTELNQFLSIGLMGGGTGEKSSLDGATPLRLQDHPYLTPSGNPMVQPEFGSKFGHLDTREQVTACVALAKRAGLDFLVLDQTRPDIEVAGRQSDRSGIAAFLSPLRAGPALRCAGQARIARPAADGKRAQSDSPPYLKVIPACALPDQREGDRPRRQLFPPGSAVTSRSKRSANGEIVACFDGYSVGLGTFSAGAADRAQELRTGLPLSSFASDSRNIDKEIDLLVRRLARRGLLEYRLGRSRNGEDQVVIEPQVPDYWPQAPQLGNADALVLSRFAYMRRRGNEMVLESPRAGALFKICDPKIATAIAMLSTPQQIKQLRRQDGFPGVELLALLLDCQILFKIDAAGESGLRLAEGDDSLVLWDFHDLLFHARSTEGRHANPLGGVYPYVGVISPLPAVRPSWPGKKIDLRKFSAAHPEAISPVAKLLRERHSTRSFDDQRPITLAELSQFLDGTARVLSRSNSEARPRRTAVTPSGRIRRRALLTSSSSIWPSTNAKGLHAASIITTPALTRWRRSASPRMSSKRCWREPNTQWARPPRPRS